MLWEVDIYHLTEAGDRLAAEVSGAVHDLRLADSIDLIASAGYLIQGNFEASDAERLATELLADRVVERTVVAPVGDAALTAPPREDLATLVHVLLKPGVMDPVAQSALGAMEDMEIDVTTVATIRKFWLPTGIDAELLAQIENRILANDAIERIVVGPLDFDKIQVGSPYTLDLQTVLIREMDDAALEKLAIEGQLYLSLVEMQTIKAHFEKLGRDPTDIELESVAQTWSEHCSHKTLAGRIAYKDDRTERHFENMLKETIFAATVKIREQMGDDDWCVSVFVDNAGVVRFDEENNICFKVETHNHPSALEPYGGANTGIGGVIRDPMGTGMGAKPICNTDVFCFAPPDISPDEIPEGVLHPRRVMQGVVSGVRDYGNRMGIPTVNGAVYFDKRYLGNPLVFCGNVGILPKEMSFKHAKPGDLIVAMGGRTGRDGIHGATFSSAELTHESETLSGGAVQIGNAITEKMVLDVLLVARDRGLYNAVTDCGAGGFSSAVGEMGEEIGAEVELEQCPLKYEGLSYTEIWISEAQERMVFAVPEEKWDEMHELCESEGVEATVIGRFVPTGRLVLNYEGTKVADLSMEFLHDGRPPVIRDAIYEPPAVTPLTANDSTDTANSLLSILGSLNVASKHWIVRQYDHEVQGGSVVKPLVGVVNDGPGDASVVRPVLGSNKGVAVSCGMNPRYGDLDTYHMAASAIDEAIRNCVAVGADPSKIAILDNFCWGSTDRPETLGSLVRSALACYDLAVELGTPFISGKDSLNNEFRPKDADEPIAIPSSLLISAMGIVHDARQCVTMDLKSPGNKVYQIGETKDEMGGSHFALVEELEGGQVPMVDPARAKATFAAVHKAIVDGLIRSCHDLSEGGLAAAAAEMAIAGRTGIEIDPQAAPADATLTEQVLLFSESNTRFLVEVAPENCDALEAAMTEAGIPCAAVGGVTESDTVKIGSIDLTVEQCLTAWQSPLDW